MAVVTGVDGLGGLLAKYYRIRFLSLLRFGRRLSRMVVRERLLGNGSAAVHAIDHSSGLLVLHIGNEEKTLAKISAIDQLRELVPHRGR